MDREKKESTFRSLRRAGQQLPEERCREILAAGRRGTLAVLGDGGYPYAVPLNYMYDRQRDCIYFHGAREGHKIDAVRRCSKVSFNVLSEGWKEEGTWWLQFDSVTVFGRIRAAEEPELKFAMLRGIGEKYYPAGTDVAKIAREAIDRVFILELRIEHITGKHVNEK